MAQWKISGRQAACSICSHPFEDGERHNSMVVFTEDHVRRGDYCHPCWEKGGIELQWPESEPAAADADTAQDSGLSEGTAATGTPTVHFSAGEPHRFWWSTTHQSKAPKTLQMDMDALQRLFLELETRTETQLRELRYVLCLLLMRKKRVKLERILRDESGESFIVHRPKSEDRYTVEVFDFTPERMAEVRAHLQAIFDGVDEDESLAQAARGDEADGSAEEEEMAEPRAE